MTLQFTVDLWQVGFWFGVWCAIGAVTAIIMPLWTVVWIFGGSWIWAAWILFCQIVLWPLFVLAKLRT